jgi:hypothetical protein
VAAPPSPVNATIASSGEVTNSSSSVNPPHMSGISLG